ncbi:MAG: type VI secretion system baseplate subunit TssG, partial [Burkholderiales bacterium]|nr:type VI secretion system baseplate subunit TssG [Burkholderiales bacterium]
MGTDKRVPDGALIDKLLREPYRFNFYQAVSLLEQATPHRRPLGHDGHKPEAVRFRSHVHLSFPPSDVINVERGETEHAPTLVTTAVMGLAGAAGPLPVPFTDMVMRRNAAREFATRDLLDIFNHRFLSFLFRARQKHHIALTRVAPDTSPFAHYLRAFAGQTHKAQHRDADWGRPQLRYTGLLAGAPRSMAALETMLSSYLGVKVVGEQLVGGWLDIDSSEWSRIGHYGGRRQALGKSTLLGKRTWDQRAGIRLHLHDLPADRVEHFLPGGRDFEALTQLTRRFLQEAFHVEVWLAARPQTPKPVALGKHGQLGWTSWLPSTTTAREPV